MAFNSVDVINLDAWANALADKTSHSKTFEEPLFPSSEVENKVCSYCFKSFPADTAFLRMIGDELLTCVCPDCVVEVKKILYPPHYKHPLSAVTW